MAASLRLCGDPHTHPGSVPTPEHRPPGHPSGSLERLLIAKAPLPPLSLFACPAMRLLTEEICQLKGLQLPSSHGNSLLGGLFGLLKL